MINRRAGASGGSSPGTARELSHRDKSGRCVVEMVSPLKTVDPIKEKAKECFDTDSCKVKAPVSHRPPAKTHPPPVDQTAVRAGVGLLRSLPLAARRSEERRV